MPLRERKYAPAGCFYAEILILRTPQQTILPGVCSRVEAGEGRPAYGASASPLNDGIFLLRTWNSVV